MQFLLIFLLLWPILTLTWSLPSGWAQERPLPLGGGGDPALRALAFPGYRLGAGDTVEVVIAGRIDVNRFGLTVSPDGMLHVPPVGPVPVAGLTLSEARQAVAARLAPILRFFDVTLILQRARTFEVQVTGEVERPGAYSATPLDRIAQMIANAGGLTPRGSSRQVTLVKNGRPEGVVDLLRFSLTGDLQENPYVREGQAIFVPPKGETVAIRGQVRRPGEYELAADRSLRTLLDLAGGPVSGVAARQAKLTRVGPELKKEIRAVDLERLLREEPTFPLQGGDVLEIPPLAALQDVAEVHGAVLGSGLAAVDPKTPGRPLSQGRYELAAGERVQDLLSKAGGPAPWADLARAYIDRRGSSGERVLVPVDLQRLLVEKDPSQDLPLRNGDILVVPPTDDRVFVSGRVKNPGAFEYRQNLMAKDYVYLAGGPDDRGKLSGAVVVTKDGRRVPLDEVERVDPGAVIQVPEVFMKFTLGDVVAVTAGIHQIIFSWVSLFLLFDEFTFGFR